MKNLIISDFGLNISVTDDATTPSCISIGHIRGIVRDLFSLQSMLDIMMMKILSLDYGFLVFKI